MNSQTTKETADRILAMEEILRKQDKVNVLKPARPKSLTRKFGRH